MNIIPNNYEKILKEMIFNQHLQIKINKLTKLSSNLYLDML